MAMGVRRSNNPFLWARIVNVILGAWLFISTFAWPHTAQSRINTWSLGLLIVLFAIFSIAQPTVRRLNTMAAVWLFFSSLAISQLAQATAWNNMIVAIAVFVVSFIGGHGDERMTSRRTQQRRKEPRHA
ncbi:MAG TPA: hypothetical protein VHV78_08790 [Gemmatimonadaceae bacterium]|jgi:uncharacterized membrane protein|nr:hypothetical protein [Gemmatimonadaceae bacterium]